MEDGPVKAGNNRRVKVRNDLGETVVARVHVEIGGRFVLLMPDGSLASIPVANANTTTSAFRPASPNSVSSLIKSKLEDGYHVMQGKYHLCIYDCRESFAKQTIAILETIHDGIYTHFKNKGFPVHPPEVLLPVVIFRTRKQFDKFSDVSDSITGYYHIINNYVVLYEESEIIIEQGHSGTNEILSTVAHEGVHQTLANIGVQPRLAVWPVWITEGLAEYFSSTEEKEELTWKGVGQVNDLRRAALEPYVSSRRNPDGEFIIRAVKSERLSTAGYAAAWGLVHLLMDRSPLTFLEYVRDLSLRLPMDNPKPSQGNEVPEAELELFQKYFRKDYASLESRLLTHLRGMKFEDPLANAAHYATVLEFRHEGQLYRTAHLSVRSQSGLSWKADEVSRLSAAQQSSVRFYHRLFPNRREAQTYAYRWLQGK